MARKIGKAAENLSSIGTQMTLDQSGPKHRVGVTEPRPESELKPMVR